MRRSGADLSNLLRRKLLPFVGEPRVTMKGDAFVLPPGAAQPIAMVIHGLTTSAVKHGALSVPEGRVTIAGNVAADHGG